MHSGNMLLYVVFVFCVECYGETKMQVKKKEKETVKELRVFCINPRCLWCHKIEVSHWVSQEERHPRIKVEFGNQK